MAGAQQVFINEFHYDNVSTDVNEGVEIAGPANSDLSAYRIVFYNGNTSAGGIFQGPVYKTFDLNGMIDDEGNGGGAVWFDIKDMQNGGMGGPGMQIRIAGQ